MSQKFTQAIIHPVNATVAELSPDVAPWEKQPFETDKWFDRFDRYARPLGYECTPYRAFKLFSVANGAVMAVPTSATAADSNALTPHAKQGLQEWTQELVDSRWALRARLWSDFDRAETVRMWRKRRLALREQEFNAGAKLMDAASAALDELPKFVSGQSTVSTNQTTGVITKVVHKKLQVPQIIGALDMAAKLSWQSAGMSEERVPIDLAQSPIDPSSVEQQKKYQLEQLTKLFMDLMASEDARAPDRAVLISKRIADMLGLDSPKQVAIQGEIDVNMKHYAVISPDDWPSKDTPVDAEYTVTTATDIEKTAPALVQSLEDSSRHCVPGVARISAPNSVDSANNGGGERCASGAAQLDSTAVDVDSSGLTSDQIKDIFRAISARSGE